MRSLRAALAACCLLPVAACAQSDVPRARAVEQSSATCTIARISDGDTVRCRDGLRVRLLLIDSPERDQRPFGEAAARQLATLIPAGSVVRLEYDVRRQDQYGRTLAYVFTREGRFVNEEMLRTGFAVVTVYPPNVKHVDRLRAVADSARQQRRGLWASSGFACLPRDRRARRC